MAGIVNLSKLIQNMDPQLNEGEYVFVSVQSLDEIPLNNIVGTIREKEGITVIIERQSADQLKLTYEFIAAWITLNVHSDLTAIGLTAAFSTALANNGISCNVVAGFYHDHIFVDHKDKDQAIKTLQDLKTAVA